MSCWRPLVFVFLHTKKLPPPPSSLILPTFHFSFSMKHCFQIETEVSRERTAVTFLKNLPLVQASAGSSKQNNCVNFFAETGSKSGGKILQGESNMELSLIRAALAGRFRKLVVTPLEKGEKESRRIEIMPTSLGPILRAEKEERERKRKAAKLAKLSACIKDAEKRMSTKTVPKKVAKVTESESESEETVVVQTPVKKTKKPQSHPGSPTKKVKVVEEAPQSPQGSPAKNTAVVEETTEIATQVGNDVATISADSDHDDE